MSNSCASCSSKPARWFSCVQIKYNNCDGTNGSFVFCPWWTLTRRFCSTRERERRWRTRLHDDIIDVIDTWYNYSLNDCCLPIRNDVFPRENNHEELNKFNSIIRRSKDIRLPGAWTNACRTLFIKHVLPRLRRPQIPSKKNPLQILLYFFEYFNHLRSSSRNWFANFVGIKSSFVLHVRRRYHIEHHHKHNNEQTNVWYQWQVDVLMFWHVVENEDDKDIENIRDKFDIVHRNHIPDISIFDVC